MLRASLSIWRWRERERAREIDYVSARERSSSAAHLLFLIHLYLEVSSIHNPPFIQSGGTSKNFSCLFSIHAENISSITFIFISMSPLIMSHKQLQFMDVLLLAQFRDPLSSHQLCGSHIANFCLSYSPGP